MKRMFTMAALAAIAVFAAGCSGCASPGSQGSSGPPVSSAPASGTVAQVDVKVGQAIAGGDLAVIGAGLIAKAAAQPGIPDAVALKGSKATVIKGWLDKANVAMRAAHTAYNTGNALLAQTHVDEANAALKSADDAGLAAARAALPAS